MVLAWLHAGRVVFLGKLGGSRTAWPCALHDSNSGWRKSHGVAVRTPRQQQRMEEVARRGRVHSATAAADGGSRTAWPCALRDRSSGCWKLHGVTVCTPRQQQQHQQQQLQHEVEKKADAEKQRGVNACLIREKLHDHRLAMCSRDVQKGDVEGISHVT